MLRKIITVVSAVQLIITLLLAAHNNLAQEQSVTDFMYGYCNVATFNSNDSFARNLDAVVKSLTQKSSQSLYNSVASSETGSQSSSVYGMYQCRGDISLSDCTSCVGNGLHLFQSGSFCSSLARGARAQYNGCYLRYENYQFVDSTGFEENPSAPTNCSTLNDSSPLYRCITAPPSPAAERRKNHTATIVGIVVAGVCTGLFCTIAVALYFLRRRQKSVKPAAQFLKAPAELFIHAGGARRFSLKELCEATDNFHPNNKVGEGGFGPVYQGTLKSGIKVAIKMLSAHSSQGKTEFVNEVNLITTVQHRNLVQLIGCCMEDSKPLLVYEYLPNRSLNLHLFDSASVNDALNWHTRFEIIVGIARGLKYLHEDSPVRIIHRDIKTSNILLDNNMNPKIADFGLARLLTDDRSHISTRVVGTLGYLAPEYAISGQLTEKADVYSFGLVALEIVSGRRVVENKFEEDKQNLLEWTWALYEKQQQLQIVDERMLKSTTGKGSGFTVESPPKVNEGEVIRVVHVALLCTQSQSQARPSMSEVHNMLGGKSKILNLPTPSTWISQPTVVQLTHSYDANPITHIEPR